MRNHSPFLLAAAGIVLALAVGCAGTRDLGNGTAQLQRGEYDAAVETLTKALGHEKMRDSDRSDALMLRGQAYLEQEEYRKALDDLKASLELDPSKTQARFYRGVALLKLGNLDSAAEDFTAVIQSYQKRSRTDFMTGRETVQDETVQMAAQSYMHLGEIDLYKERYPEAMHNFDTAVRLVPFDPELYLIRGGALRLMEQEDFAEKDLAMFERLSDNATDAPESRLAPLKLKESIRLYDSGDYGDSVRLASEAIADNPQYAAAYRRRGLARLQQHKLEAAEKDFGKAIALDTEYLEGWLYRAYVRMEQREYKTALRDINHVLSQRPDWTEATLYRGMVLSQDDKHAAALEDFRTVLEARPEDVTALQGEAYSLFNLEQYDQAMAVLQKLLTLAPDSATANRMVGLIYMQHEQYEQALASLNKAEQLGDDSMQLYLAQGAVLRAMGNEEQAAMAFDKALDASQAEDVKAMLPILR